MPRRLHSGDKAVLWVPVILAMLVGLTWLLPHSTAPYMLGVHILTVAFFAFLIGLQWDSGGLVSDMRPWLTLMFLLGLLFASGMSLLKGLQKGYGGVIAVVMVAVGVSAIVLLFYAPFHLGRALARRRRPAE